MKLAVSLKKLFGTNVNTKKHMFGILQVIQDKIKKFTAIKMKFTMVNFTGEGEIFY